MNPLSDLIRSRAALRRGRAAPRRAAAMVAIGGLLALALFGPWLATKASALDLRINCTEAALRDALNQVAAAGGGTITFNCSNTTIDIVDTIVFRGNNMALDGETRNLTFRYSGPDACNQVEGQDRFLEIYGDNNTLKNFTLWGFPDGIHFQSGNNNVADNLRYPIICEDAISNGGNGFVAWNTVIRNSYFDGSADKAIMILTSGSITVENSEFVNCRQPVRAGGSSGRVVVRNNIFRGSSSGPRFNGGASGMYVTFEGNSVTDSTYGIRVYDSVQAVIRNNTFSKGTSGTNAVWVFGSGRVRLEGNTISGYTSGAGVLIQNTAQADLGGGSVVIDGSSTPSLGNNSIKNGINGSPWDVDNQTTTTVKAENNFWDHTTVAAVDQYDVNGPADVDPLAGGAPAPTPTPGPTSTPTPVPPTPTPGPTATPGTGTTVDFRIAAGGNDGVEQNSSGAVTLTGSSLLVGTDRLDGFRFTAVTVPRNATIDSAVLSMRCRANCSRSISLRYRSEASGNSAAFTTASFNLSSRADTAAFVDDVPAAWATGAYNNSPELKTIVQEIVNRADWASGNALALFIHNNGSASDRSVNAYEDSGATEAILRITYR